MPHAPSDDSVSMEQPLGIASFVRSRLFANLFAQGMELVEETATYLDNGGRHAAKSLDREAAMVYAGVSMRLTTKLMQIASWLLVLRAVRDGEMTIEEAHDGKYRLENSSRTPLSARSDTDVLPETLRELISDSETLYARIARLDHDLFSPPVPAFTGKDAKGQLETLKSALKGF